MIAGLRGIRQRKLAQTLPAQYSACMGKRRAAAKSKTTLQSGQNTTAATAGKPSALLDTRVVYCGDCLDQLRNLPDNCIDLIYIDYTRPRCVELARVPRKRRRWTACSWSVCL